MPSRWLAGLGPGCEIRANATTATCATATTGPTTVTSAPVSVSVVAPPVGQTTIEIAQPADGATLYTLTPTHVMPSITTAPGFSVLRVNDYADGVQFAYRTKAPYYAHVRFLVTGTYALTVEVIDSGGYKSVSTPVTVTIVDGTPSVVYYHNDASGSPVAASDQAGSLVWLEAYRPWGERVLGDDAGTKNGIWYAGKPVEDTTGLAYLGARWYSPEIGRFYGVDPVAFREEEPKSVNRYAYANNNPYRYVDPDGQMPLLILAAPIIARIGAPFATAFAAGFLIDATVQLVGTGRVDFQRAMEAGAEVMPLGPFAAMMARTPQGAASVAGGLPDSALVARGGNAANQSAARIDSAIGPSRTPGVSGFSAQCNGGICLSELGKFIPNKKLGVTTVGEIRAIGGDVISTPGFGNHVTVTGVTGEAASPLFRIFSNPNPLVVP